MVVLDVVEELNDEEKDGLEDEVGKEVVFVLDLVTRLALVVAEDNELESPDPDALVVGVREVDDGVGREELISGREVMAE